MQMKSYLKEIEVKLSQGPTVTVEFYVEPPEPEVGYFGSFIAFWRIIDDCGIDTTEDYNINEKEAERILKLCYDAIS